MKRVVIYVIVVLTLQACKKGGEDIDPPLISDGPALYFRGIINGKKVALEAGNNGYSQGVSWGGVGIPVWGSHLGTKNMQDERLSVIISNYSQIVGIDPQKDLEKTLVVGNKNFSNVNTGVQENEVLLSFSQGGFFYESIMIDQDNPKFNVLSVKDTVYEDRKFMIVRVEFEAQLYSQINGDTIKIKEGQARLAYLATP